MERKVFIENFTLLEKENIRGKGRLDLLKQKGNACEISDFAILLGGECYHHEAKILENAEKNDNDEIDDKDEMRGWWWAKTDRAGELDFSSAVYEFEPINHRSVRRRNGGVRPVLSIDEKAIASSSNAEYDQMKSDICNSLKQEKLLKKIKYGFYPQTVVEKELSEKIEFEYQNGNLAKTQMKYTTDKNLSSDMEASFEENVNFEYEYNGEKYIRLVANENCAGKKLSDGRIVELGEVYWVKVEPINWLIDKTTGIIISEKILFSGIQFRNSNNKLPGFDNTDIKSFLNKYFSKEFNVENKYYEILEKYDEEIKDESENVIDELMKYKEYIESEDYYSNSPANELIHFSILNMHDIQNYRGEPTDLFRESGLSASATDFARLLGCRVFEYNYAQDGVSLLDCKGCWYTSTPGERNSKTNYRDSVKVIDDAIGRNSVKTRTKNIGVRPSMSWLFKDISKYPIIKESEETIEIEYGEYPQNIVDEKANKLFEQLFNRLPGKLAQTAARYDKSVRLSYFVETGKTYTTLDENDKVVSWCEYADPYGEKYIRFVADKIGKDNYLSNGLIVKPGNVYWIKVEPVRWVVSKKTNKMISKNILLSGIPLLKESRLLYQRESSFDKTFLSQFLTRHFSNDLLPTGKQYSGHGQR